MIRIQTSPPAFDRTGYRWNIDTDSDGDVVVEIQHNAIKPFWMTGWAIVLAGTCEATEDESEAVQAAVESAIAQLYDAWATTMRVGDFKRSARLLARRSTSISYNPDSGEIKGGFTKPLRRTRRYGLTALTALLGGVVGGATNLRAAVIVADRPLTAFVVWLRNVVTLLASKRDPSED